ncbi:protoglobin domain-containing protein [Deinococcus sp. Marseille-Q6407]|uniref:protoglobin domain-containing protein n=1 Tax=Deinococcus sp. Marseille-Q6407 TaxID=2969223 RepID=UPI0021C22AD1|nr:protoglobin domain-containing protein [Deinococcus sp. Marseille-Q6407]
MTGERKSWEIKDTAVAAELIDLMNLTEQDRRVLQALQGAAEHEAVQLADDFYARAQSHEPTSQYFEGVDVDHLHRTLQDWFRGLFAGQYDAAYAQKRMRIGEIHVKIGLPVRYPLAMLDLIQKHGEVVASSSDETQQALDAFRKILALDIAVFNQAYEDNQLKHLGELMGSERLARRLLQGEV